MLTAVIQHDVIWEDAAATCARVGPMIDAAAAGGARLIVLPEMFATGFSMALDRVAEEAGGPVERFLCARAASLGVWLIGSVAQRAASPAADPTARRGVNVALVAGPDGGCARYVKLHPFTHVGEHERYDAGDRHLTVDLGGLSVTVFICYDLRFADEFWATAEHTDAYVVIASWPASRREHWRTLLRARAIENQAYVVGCNRVGTVGPDHYSGDSAVIDPLGRTLTEAAHDETTLRADLRPAEVRAVRAQFAFLKDRR